MNTDDPIAAPSGSSSPPSTTRTADQPAMSDPTQAPMAPGDEAPEGTPGTAMGICHGCGGSGRGDDGGTCRVCEGTGQVNVGIGGA